MHALMLIAQRSTLMLYAPETLQFYFAILLIDLQEVYINKLDSKWMRRATDTMQ